MKNSIKEEFTKQDENNLVEDHLFCRNCDSPVTADDIICPASGVDLKKDYKLEEEEIVKQVFICKHCGRILSNSNSDRCLTCEVKIDKNRQLKENQLKRKKMLKDELDDRLEEKFFCPKCGNRLDKERICLGCNIIITEEKIFFSEGSDNKIKQVTKRKIIKYNIFQEIKDKLLNIFSGNFFRETTGSKIRKYRAKEKKKLRELVLNYKLAEANISKEEYDNTVKVLWIISVLLIISSIVYMTIELSKL